MRNKSHAIRVSGVFPTTEHSRKRFSSTTHCGRKASLRAPHDSPRSVRLPLSPTLAWLQLPSPVVRREDTVPKTIPLIFSLRIPSSNSPIKTWRGREARLQTKGKHTIQSNLLSTTSQRSLFCLPYLDVLELVLGISLQRLFCRGLVRLLQHELLKGLDRRHAGGGGGVQRYGHASMQRMERLGRRDVLRRQEVCLLLLMVHRDGSAVGRGGGGGVVLPRGGAERSERRHLGGWGAEPGVSPARVVARRRRGPVVVGHGRGHAQVSGRGQGHGGREPPARVPPRARGPRSVASLVIRPRRRGLASARPI